jgi:hypothetical protein
VYAEEQKRRKKKRRKVSGIERDGEMGGAESLQVLPTGKTPPIGFFYSPRS